MSTENIAMLWCVAEYLEMTEDIAVGNLQGRTEAYLSEVALKSLPGAISVLHSTETLVPMAEKMKLVSRCIDMIAFMACKESQSSRPAEMGGGMNAIIASHHPKAVVEWWAEELTVFRIDVFQRVLIAMMARGFKQYALGPILMLYAQKSLRGLDVFFGKDRKRMELEEEHEKRVVLETIVSLLPREKNSMSVSFLSMLLRAAIFVETTVACRLDLEKRMASQLGQAVLDDLLIPSYSLAGDIHFDLDTVQRIMMNYLDQEEEGPLSEGFNLDEECVCPTTPTPMNDMERVGKLMETYLAEIASDRNLSVSKFIGLAEIVPEQSRITEDGIYRAIDIYLKAHPALSDVDRKKVCSMMDCQKLSREACAHAALNDRLPVQTVVQVLYYEQQRLRETMNGTEAHAAAIPSKPSVVTHPVSNELSRLKRENEDLKIELVKMKMRLREMERSTLNSNMGSPVAHTPISSADKPPLPRKSVINSVSKRLGRLYPFVRADGTPGGVKGRTKPPKDRRHSIS